MPAWWRALLAPLVIVLLAGCSLATERGAVAEYGGAVAELQLAGPGPVGMRLRFALDELAVAVERLPEVARGEPPARAAELIRGAEAHLALRTPVEARVLEDSRRALVAASAVVLEVASDRCRGAPAAIAGARRFDRAARAIGAGSRSPRLAIYAALAAGRDALVAIADALAWGGPL